jgi:hypothetical protein
MIKEMGMKARSAVIELQDGTVCRMDFDLGALAHAEGVYEEHFGRIAGIHDIIGELIQGRARALMAITYGAMLSAGEKLTWDDFGKKIYTFENYDRLSETISDEIAAMMRGGDDEEDEEGDSKNARSRGGS